jgi:hypothetical protein
MGNRYGSLNWGKEHLVLKLLENASTHTEFLALVDKFSPQGEDYYPIAAISWHKDFDGLITCPAIQNHRDDWLSSLFGGYTLQGDTLRRKVKDWIKSHETEIIELLVNPNADTKPLFDTFII